MRDSISTPLGVIEGFFGRDWSWSARGDYAAFLAGQGYQFYLYAPKNDSCLRRDWQRDWPAAQATQMQNLRARYRDAGIAFGLGLSPFEIYRQAGPESRAALTRKIKALNQLQPDILCLLFDDMRGDLPDLARQQIDLVRLAADHTSATRIIFCPTYYSFDPVLEKVFGARPSNYWETLGRDLDPEVDIFWTGPKVCSESYPLEHLQTVQQLLNRRPFLWDNYPVNDSASLSTLLRLRAFGRDRAQLDGYVAGHAVNPMNQPCLSQIPLSSLPRAYREGETYQPEEAFIQACQTLCEPALAKCLVEDIGLLQDQGLNALSSRQQDQLRHRYRPFADRSACARELLAWLDGDYAFDPACLTQ